MSKSVQITLLISAEWRDIIAREVRKESLKFIKLKLKEVFNLSDEVENEEVKETVN